MILGIFIAFPWLALVPVITFTILYRFSKYNLAKLTAIIWLVYLVYEYGMYFRILCSGECNIRVDLLVIYLFLLIISIVALIKGLLTIKRKKELQNQS